MWYDIFGSIVFVIFFQIICCRSSDRETLTPLNQTDKMLADILQPGVSTTGSSAGAGLQFDFLQPEVQASEQPPAATVQKVEQVPDIPSAAPASEEVVLPNVEHIAHVPVDAAEENVQFDRSAASRYLFIFS